MAWTRTLVNAFIRQATAAAVTAGGGATATSVLTALQAGQYAVVSTGAGQVIQATVNGKTVQFGVGDGVSRSDIMEICECALQILAAGGTSMTSRSFGRF